MYVYIKTKKPKQALHKDRNLPDFHHFHEKQGESNTLNCSRFFQLSRQCCAELTHRVYLKRGVTQDCGSRANSKEELFKSFRGWREQAVHSPPGHYLSEEVLQLRVGVSCPCCLVLSLALRQWDLQHIRKYKWCRRMGLISASLKNRELCWKQRCKGRASALIG